jgi:hypothetical protein
MKQVYIIIPGLLVYKFMLFFSKKKLALHLNISDSVRLLMALEQVRFNS